MLRLVLSPLSAEGKPKLSYTVGSVVSIILLGFIIFLLQRYYELNSNSQTSVSSKKFLGMALTGVSIAALIALSVAILIVVLALLNA